MADCKLWVTADVAFCSASIYSLIGVCIDRFQAVTDPFGWVLGGLNVLCLLQASGVFKFVVVGREVVVVLC